MPNHARCSAPIRGRHYRRPVLSAQIRLSGSAFDAVDAIGQDCWPIERRGKIDAVNARTKRKAFLMLKYYFQRSLNPMKVALLLE